MNDVVGSILQLEQVAAVLEAGQVRDRDERLDWAVARRREIRSFATTTNALVELRDWLVAEQVTLVVLEATGDYWRVSTLLQI